MKDLKYLTPQECETIASIVEPDIEWQVIKSRAEWQGFDLIEKGGDARDSKYIFQIDFRPDEELGNKQRFRLYKNLHEYTVDQTTVEKIKSYIKSLALKKEDEKWLHRTKSAYLKNKEETLEDMLINYHDAAEQYMSNPHSEAAKTVFENAIRLNSIFIERNL